MGAGNRLLQVADRWQFSLRVAGKGEVIGMRAIATVYAMLGVSLVIGLPLWEVFEPEAWQTRSILLMGIACLGIWAMLRLPAYLGKKKAPVSRRRCERPSRI